MVIPGENPLRCGAVCASLILLSRFFPSFEFHTGFRILTTLPVQNEVVKCKVILYMVFYSLTPAQFGR